MHVLAAFRFRETTMFEQCEVRPWERVTPPLWWPAAERYVIADRTLPDGRRQHLVEGSVAPGTVIANADVIGYADCPDAPFSETPSHLSSAG